MASTTSQPTVVDLFSGAGGLSLGFEMAGFRISAAVEIDPVHAATHRLNFPNCPVVERDVVGLSGDEIRSAAALGADEPTVVVGGPPCQGFSAGGRHVVGDPRNRLVCEFARIVNELRPAYFLFENVKGFVSRGNQALVAELKAELTRHYHVLGPVLVDASQWGVPQRRRRVFIRGYRRDVPAPGDPFTLTAAAKAPTVWDAIGDLAFLEGVKSLQDEDVYQGQLPSTESEYALRLRQPREGSPPIADPTSASIELTGCRRSRHSPVIVERFDGTKPGCREPVSRFFRLDAGGASSTLRAGTGSDKGSFTAPRPIHPAFPRCITVREAARLQSFPDWFRFDSTTWHGFRQVGNSVAPLLASRIARSYLVG